MHQERKPTRTPQASPTAETPTPASPTANRDALAAADLEDVGGHSYVVRPGDTLRGLADRATGDAANWTVLAECNGLEGEPELGDSLVLPEGWHAEALGELPHIPMPTAPGAAAWPLQDAAAAEDTLGPGFCGQPVDVDLAFASNAGAQQRMSQATLAAPAGPSPPAPRPPESQPTKVTNGLTDYYMALHWNPTTFHTTAQAVGYPGGSDVSVVDRLLPPDTSEGARFAVNFGCALATGLIDDFLLNKACAKLGVPADIVNGLIETGGEAAAFAEINDTLGVALVAGFAAADFALDTFDWMLQPIASTVASVEFALGAIGALTFVLGQAVAFGAAILGPPGVAFVQATIIELDAIVAAMEIVVECIKIPLQLTLTGINSLQFCLFSVKYVYCDALANKSEANGHFENADKYRALANTQMLSMTSEMLEAFAELIAIIPFVGKAAGKVTKFAAKGVKTGIRLGMKAGARLPDLGIALPTDRRMDDEATAPDIGALPGNGPLAVARQQTETHFRAAAVALRTGDPDWHQALINDILAPELSFEEAVSPTAWILAAIESVPFLWALVRDLSLEGLASGLDAAAGLVPYAQAFADQVSAAIVEAKPQLDAMVSELDTFVAKQAVSLVAVEDMARGVREATEQVRVLGIDAVVAPIDEAIAALDSVDLSVDVSGLPAPMQPGVAATVAQLLAARDAARDALEALREQTIETYTSTVGEVLQGLEAHAATLEAAVAEGGQLQVQFAAEVDAVKAEVHAACQAFDDWDGSVTMDMSAAAAWLSAMAAACRAAIPLEEEVDPWPEIVASVAQPAVDAWHAAHDEDVKATYYPTVPAWEIEAVQTALTQALARTDLEPRDRERLKVAAARCLAFKGLQGDAPLQRFFAAVRNFVALLEAA